MGFAALFFSSFNGFSWFLCDFWMGFAFSFLQFQWIFMISWGFSHQNLISMDYFQGKHRQPRKNRENKNRGPGCPVSIFKPQKKTLSNDIRLVEPHLKFQPQRNGGWCCWIPLGHSTVCDVEHGHWQLVYRLKTGDFNHNRVSLAEAISISSGKHTKNIKKLWNITMLLMGKSTN